MNRYLVTNSTDRTVRMHTIAADTDLDNLGGIVVTPVHKFQDLINRSPWNGIGFSGDGEYVIGGEYPSGRSSSGQVSDEAMTLNLTSFCNQVPATRRRMTSSSGTEAKERCRRSSRAQKNHWTTSL